METEAHKKAGNAKTVKCDFCGRRKAIGFLYREIGFGVEVKVGNVCIKCKISITGNC